MGGGIEGAGVWQSYPLLDAGEGVRRKHAPVPTLVGGTEKGESDRGNGPGQPDGQVGRPGCELGRLVQGGLFFLFLFCIFFYLFLFPFLFYLI